ncbi:MAG: hypothetical protein RR012_01180 [Oscillospiraceae bacterium]
MATKKEKTVEPAEKFSKDSLLNAAVFANRRDALAVVIKDGEKITIEDAQERLDKFMKGKVN